MTASAAKLEANRANAAFSTGPRTQEGKAASARNSITHGLTAAAPLVLPGEQPEFDSLRDGLLLSIQPAGTLEDVFFSRLVHATWNLRRCDLLEASLASAGDPLASTDHDTRHRAVNLDLYRTRAERSLFRCTRELRLLQNERSTREFAAARNSPLRAEAIDMIPPMADIGLVDERTQIPKQERFLRPMPIDSVVCARIADLRARRAEEAGAAVELAAEPNEATAGAAEPNEATAPLGTYRREGPKVGRNESCPCGSGMKFKRCCGR